MLPEIYVESKSVPKAYYRLSHSQKPVHRSIESLIKEFENSEKDNAHIYYLLESPTLIALKQLRQNIDRSFIGEARTSLLVRLIPILPIEVPVSKNRCELIESYMLYTKYVFGGASFLI